MGYYDKRFLKYVNYGDDKINSYEHFNIEDLSDFEKLWAEYAIEGDKLEYTITNNIMNVKIKCISD